MQPGYRCIDFVEPRCDGQLKDMTLEHLDLFERDSAKDLTSLIMAGQGIVISTDEIDRILSLLGDPIPHFLQLVLDPLMIGEPADSQPFSSPPQLMKWGQA